MIEVAVRARINEVYGYAQHARDLVQCLRGAGVTVKLIPLPPPSLLPSLFFGATLYDPMPASARASFDGLTRTRLDPGYAFLELCTPPSWRHDDKAGWRIGYTTFETDAIPASWKKRCNLLKDEIWVPTPFNRETFENCGVRTPIVVMPEGFDTTRLRPDGEKLALPGAASFTFLSVFNENPRKDWRRLLRAFCAEFRRTEPVRLVCKVHATTARQERRIRAAIESASREGQGPDVLLLNRAISGSDMPRLYRACDAFVLPSRGEGWGRPYTEALLCGLPVIYSDCSAMRHNLNDRIAYPIAGKMVAVADTLREEPELSDSWIVRKYFLDGAHRWYQNSEESLRAQMRQVYEHQDEARHRALLGRQWIVERYSLDAVSELVVERLGRRCFARGAG